MLRLTAGTGMRQPVALVDPPAVEGWPLYLLLLCGGFTVGVLAMWMCAGAAEVSGPHPVAPLWTAEAAELSDLELDAALQELISERRAAEILGQP